MKTIVKNLPVIFFILLISNLYGQNRNWGLPLRDRIMQAKLQKIQKALELEQAAFIKFRPIYVRYEKEVAAINFRDQGGMMRVNPDSLTSDEAENMVMAQLRNAKMLIALREKYYSEFKTALTPQQIIKLYQTEAAIRRQVMQEFRRRFGNRFNQ